MDADWVGADDTTGSSPTPKSMPRARSKSNPRPKLVPKPEVELVVEGLSEAETRKLSGAGVPICDIRVNTDRDRGTKNRMRKWLETPAGCDRGATCSFAHLQ